MIFQLSDGVISVHDDMKTVPSACERPSDFGIKTANLSNIGRSKMEGQLHTSEMQACFQQLKDIVPTIPQGKKLSKTQLLQHVIDYILDLELALRPSVLSPSTLSSTAREPLTEKSEPNQIVSEVMNAHTLFMLASAEPSGNKHKKCSN